MTISLVIPAYNEEKRIIPFLKSIKEELERSPQLLSEIIVVNDGSTDSTAKVVSQFADIMPSLTLLDLKENQGKGGAVQAGVMKSTGDAIVFMDADGATPASELPKMAKELAQSDIAIGNRWMPGANTERHSFLRQFSGWLYRNYMALFGLGAIDTMCGFKGYKNEVAKDLFSDLIEKKWLFDTEIAYKAVKRGYSIKNIPIEWESKDGSKLDTVTLIKSALAIFPLLQKINTLEAKRLEVTQ